MKKRVLSLLLAVIMLLALTVMGGGAFAASEEEDAPTARLAQIDIASPGYSPEHYEFTYSDDSALPSAVHVTSGEDSSTEYTFTYNEQGWLIEKEEEFPNSTSKTTYTYNENGDVLTYDSESTTTYDDEVSTTSSHTEYTYDENGLCTGETSSYDSQDWSYETEIEYLYDEAGNQVGFRSTETYSDGSELISNVEYTLDADGNIIKTEYDFGDGDGETQESVYDELGRLVEATITSGDDYTSHQTMTHTPLVRFSYSETSNRGIERKNASVSGPCDNQGRSLLYILLWELEGEPELTFDEEGNLVRVESGETYIDFTYEPIAG